MSQEIQKLNMEVEIGQFYIWKETQNLKANEVALWHSLMYLSYSAGWVKWISSSISTLESKTGLKKDPIYAARKKLEKLGRIEVIEGRGNQSAKYRLIPFVADYYTEDEYIEEVDPVQDDAKQGTPEATEEPPRPSKQDNLKKNIFKKIRQVAMMPSPKMVDNMLFYLEQNMQDDLLVLAVDIAEKDLPRGKPLDKLNYANGTMRNWLNNGIKTIEEYQEHEKQREESINGRNSNSGKYSNSNGRKGKRDSFTEEDAEKAGVTSL